MGGHEPKDAKPPPLEWLGRGVAVFFCLFMCIILGAGGAVGILALWLPPWRRMEMTYLATAIYAVGAPGEYFSLHFLNHRLERILQVDLIELALEQKVFSGAVRPLISLWWASHFVLAVLLAHWLAEYYLKAGGAHTTAWFYSMAIFVRFAGAMAANFYMLLAVAALWRDAQLLRQVWRLRLLVDLGAALVPLPALRLWW
jgi:hypothetical protein